MNTEIIVSVLGVILSAILSLNLVNWRLNKIEQKLDEHNGYAEKMSNMTTDIAVIKTTLQHMQEDKKWLVRNSMKH